MYRLLDHTDKPYTGTERDVEKISYWKLCRPLANLTYTGGCILSKREVVEDTGHMPDPQAVGKEPEETNNILCRDWSRFGRPIWKAGQPQLYTGTYTRLILYNESIARIRTLGE